MPASLFDGPFGRVYGFYIERERLSRHLEAKDVALCRSVSRRRRRIARSLAGHERFKLVNGLATGHREPFSLGLGDGDAGELSRTRPVERASFEGIGDRGQLLEHFGDT